MGNILIRKKTKMFIPKSKTNAVIVKDKNGKCHCSKCGAFISNV